MGDLPFAVVHGAWLWAVGIAAGVLVGFTVARWIRGRGEGSRAQADVAKWTARVGVPILARTEGEIVVTGTLGGGTAATLVVEGIAAKPGTFHDRGHEVWVDYRGDVLDLAGAVRVLRGTTAIVASKLPSSTPNAIVSRLPGRGRRYDLVSVSPGDAVIVHGALVATAGTQPVDRFGRRRWTLEPAPGNTEVELVATAPRVGAPPLGWAARFVVAAALGGVSWLALYGLGTVARARAEAADYPDDIEAKASRLVPARLALTDPLAIAAALPGSRTKALELLEHRYDRRFQRTAESLEQRRRLARIRGGCAAEAAILRVQDRYDEMLAVADSCDDRASAAEALLLLGRYDEAATRAAGLPIYPHRDGVAAIGAGRWLDAAKIAAATRELLAKPDPGPSLLTAEQRVAAQPRFDCAEQLFRLRAGERDAADRLHAMVGRDPFCKLIEAVAQPADRQAAALAAAYAVAPDATTQFEIELLAWAAGGELTDAHLGTSLHEAISIAPPSDRGARVPLFAPAALATRRDRPGSRGFVVTHTWNAYYLMLRGDLAGAAREARLAGGSDKPVDSYPQLEAQAFETSLALRTGAMPPFPVDAPASQHPALVDDVQIRVGNHSAQQRMTAFPPDCNAIAGDAMKSAIAGDGAPLADFLTSCDLHWHSVGALLAVLPRVDKNRGDLAARIPYLHVLFGASVDDVPFSSVRDGALHRDLARLAGDAQAAARWQGILDKHLAALADRDRLVAMLVWKLL